EADAACVDHELVVEAHRDPVAAERLEDDRLDPAVTQRLVAAGEGAQVLDARHLEPDEIRGVVRDPLRVGVGEAHAHGRREGVAPHGARAYPRVDRHSRSAIYTYSRNAMTGSQGGEHMESTVEQRLTYLEARVKTLEGLLGAAAAAAPAPTPKQPAKPAPWPKPAAAAVPAATPKAPRDLEELLGGRVLGWVGGIAVAIAAVFFVVMAVRNGWIGEAARMELAFAGSAVLVVFGGRLYERRGRTQAALATVAAGLAGLYASDAATTLHYHLVSSPLGLVIAGVVGALALATAVRWSSQEIAGIGIVGSLLAPVFVDAGPHTSSLVFMTIALVAAIGVVV